MLAALLVATLQEPTDADAAAGAGTSFVECVQMFAASPSRAAFLKLTREVGRGVEADMKPTAGGLAIDDAGGRGCRVTYRGDKAKADRLAEAYPRLVADCPDRTVDPAGVTCPSGSGSPPFRLEILRSQASGGQAVVAATLVDLRP